MKIEDIREKQAAEAESHIRAQFKMEKIVYCQDDLYVGDLTAVRAEIPHTMSSGKDLPFSAPKESSVVVEMLSHTSAYFSVSSQAVIQQICCPQNATAETPSARSCWSQHSLECLTSTVQGTARGCPSASFRFMLSFCTNYLELLASGESARAKLGCISRLQDAGYGD